MPQTPLRARLAPLARRQALELSPSRFDFDTGRLIKVLEKTLAEVRTADADAASMSASAVDAPGPSPTDAQRAREQREEASQRRTTSVPQGAPAAPGWRRFFSARPRVLIGVGLGIAGLLALLAAIIALSRGGDSANATQGDKLIFEDDFSTRASGWAAAGQNRSSGTYAEGRYRIDAPPLPDGATRLNLPLKAGSVYPLAPRDLRIDVDAHKRAGSDEDAGYGIACRADINGTSAYVFGIAATNSYAEIGKLFDHPPWYKPLRTAQTTLVRESGNHLRAICTSEEGQQAVRLEFLIDGRMVAKATDTENPFPPGSVGVSVGTGPKTKNPIVAEFDNFVVTRE